MRPRTSSSCLSPISKHSCSWHQRWQTIHHCAHRSVVATRSSIRKRRYWRRSLHPDDHFVITATNARSSKPNYQKSRAVAARSRIRLLGSHWLSQKTSCTSSVAPKQENPATSASRRLAPPNEFFVVLMRNHPGSASIRILLGRFDY